MMSASRLILLVTALMGFCSPADGGNWPQILGPGRDGVAVDEELLDDWPSAGPETAWTVPVGQGFAGVAVTGDVLVLFHRVANNEVVEARHAKTGANIWSRSFPCRYQSGMSSDSGPRCVPLIAADRIFVFGVQGDLRCLDFKTGTEIWNRDTWKDFSAPEGYFGAGSSPVVFQDRVIVNVGGRNNAAVVAFSTKDGSTVWQSFDDTASYSSPIVADIDGTTHVIAVTRLHTVSLNPETGAVRFSFPFGARGPTVNGATPVLLGSHLFVSASYRVGSVWASISAAGTETVDSGEKLLATQYATPVRYENLLFAVDGRQDIGTAELKCIDPERQQVLWTEDGFAYGTLIRVQDEFLYLTCEGDLIRFAADRAGYREKQRSHVLESTARGYRLPAISDGRLYVRDDDRLKCLLVGKTDE